jgi:hypothetical protein
MNSKTRQTKLVLTSFALFAFLACGVSGVFCSMPSSATETPHSQPASHHSSSVNRACPDQHKNSEKEFKALTLNVVHVVELDKLEGRTDFFKSSISKIFFKEGTLIPSAYPPPFLLFSVLLN